MDIENSEFSDIEKDLQYKKDKLSGWEEKLHDISRDQVLGNWDKIIIDDYANLIINFLPDSDIKQYVDAQVALGLHPSKNTKKNIFNAFLKIEQLKNDIINSINK